MCERSDMPDEIFFRRAPDEKGECDPTALGAYFKISSGIDGSAHSYIFS